MKTITIDNVEYETETHDFNKTLSEIKIPKGWRLWKASDFEKFTKEDFEILNLKDSWFFIKQPFKFNKKKDYVAWFVAGSVGAVLSCVGVPADRDAGLGVRFCREVKK